LGGGGSEGTTACEQAVQSGITARAEANMRIVATPA